MVKEGKRITPSVLFAAIGGGGMLGDLIMAPQHHVAFDPLVKFV